MWIWFSGTMFLEFVQQENMCSAYCDAFGSQWQRYEWGYHALAQSDNETQLPIREPTFPASTDSTTADTTANAKLLARPPTADCPWSL